MHADQASRRIAGVTGATGAIGEAITRQLADLGLSVVMITRDPGKAQSAVDRIINDTGNQRISFVSTDLSREKEIRKLASSWEGNLDILINNAAVSPRRRQESADGIELQFATNVLGYFWMMRYFKDVLSKSSPARIINVASYWAGGLEIDDLEFKRRPYHNHDAYRQSKQANRMLTPIFADLYEPLDITVNSCHPGDVNSKLSNDLGFGGSQSPAAGALTPVWLATEDEVKSVTGRYFEHQQEVICQFSSLGDASKQLFEICDSYTQSA